MADPTPEQIRATLEQIRGVRSELIPVARLISDALDAIAEREKHLAERDQLWAQKGAQAAIEWLGARGLLRNPAQRVRVTVRDHETGIVDIDEPLN